MDAKFREEFHKAALSAKAAQEALDIQVSKKELLRKVSDLLNSLFKTWHELPHCEQVKMVVNSGFAAEDVCNATKEVCERLGFNLTLEPRTNTYTLAFKQFSDGENHTP